VDDNQTLHCIQIISLPSQSVWSIKFVGDCVIAAGCSDSRIYLFGDNVPKAKDEISAAFHNRIKEARVHAEELASSSLSGAAVLENLEKLPSDPNMGDTRLVKRNGVVEAYRWNGINWDLVGQVVERSDQGKMLFDGKEYDFVFDVDFDGIDLKLPYNRSGTLFYLYNL